MDENLLANQTLQRVREALEKGEVAGVPEVIRLIQELSAKAFSITIKELADLISRDVAVTAKVISAANTVGYNPWAIPISTVSQAIQVIGFERVRNLAISLLLAENAERTHSEEQREAAAMALQSGFLAQELANLTDQAMNAEQAFICASLRNYGKLIMTTFLLDDYRRARGLEAEMGIDAAFREVFGLTPLELGLSLLTSRNLPEAILSALQDVPSERVDSVAKATNHFSYLALADFSVRLTELAVDPKLNVVEFERASTDLARRYHKWIPVPSLQIDEILERTEGMLNNLRRTHGLRSLSSRVMESLAHRVAHADLPPVAPPEGIPVPDPEIAAAIVVDEPETTGERSPNQVILDAIEEMTSRIGDRSITFSRAVTMLLQAVHRQLRSTDSILFLFDRSRKRFVPRLGLGPIFSAIEKTESLDPANRDVFGISLTRLEDVFVENATDPKILRFLPAWLKKDRTLRSFILLPLQESGAAYGLIWSGCTKRQIITVTNHTLRELRALRTHVTTIKNIDRKKRADSKGLPPPEGTTTGSPESSS